jgi:hypothetical protein
MRKELAGPRIKKGLNRVLQILFMKDALCTARDEQTNVYQS